MITNILDYLEKTAERVPEKTAFSGENGSLSFKELLNRSQRLGSYLHTAGYYKKPVVIFMEKGADAIAATFGVIYAGNYYVVIDEEMPAFRIELILKTLEADCMICDETTEQLADKFGYQGRICKYERMIHDLPNLDALDEIRRKQIDTDPIYAVFTSGSTGVPKGVLACHRSVIDYIESFTLATGMDETNVFANQAPLYFDAPLKEIGATIKFGATTYIVPKQLFMFPIKLVEYLNEHKINTLCWAASALSLVSSMKTFNKIIPEYVKTITFVGEVFPVKQLNEWKRVLPDASFYNLYGPTETTGVCCVYHVDREFDLEEMIPAGKPFKNTSILLLDENGKEVQKGEVGEICVKGTCLTLGYYKNPEKTAECFVQNPLNPIYPELIYKTGDLGRLNEDGDLIYVSRKDFQIKHMGHRIELGEIEVVAGAMEGIASVCCLFDNEKKKIIFFYTGEVSKADVAAYIKEKLPRYMFPSYFEQLDRMPYTPNGKIDRVKLKEHYESK